MSANTKRLLIGNRPKRDTLLSAGIFLVCTCICQVLTNFGTADQYSTLLFVLAVLLISWLAYGYVYGFVSALLAVFCVNYFFTYPYMTMNFGLSGYPLTFVVFLSVSLITGTLTTRAKQRDELLIQNEKEKLRADLLRSVSHDIRTPLTSIVGATNTILDSADMDEATKRQLLLDVRNESTWLVRVIENLLSITRLGDGMTLKEEPWAIDEIFAEAAQKFRSRYPNIQTKMTIAPDLPFVPMDPILIEQVVDNLLENAAQHGETTSEIRMEARCDQENLLITVEDDGRGIPEDILEHLFDRSLLEKSNLSGDKARNMGLGLAVCNAIMTAHQGKISATNTASGARFMLTLPLEGLAEDSNV